MKTSTCAALLLLAVGLTNAASAESYNLHCISDSYPGDKGYLLTIRENWLSPRLPPDISQVGDEPGKTAPVDVKVYTADQIKVTFPVRLGADLDDKDAEVNMTIDRNTGRAALSINDLWLTHPDGSRHRIVFEKQDLTCIRILPKF